MKTLEEIHNEVSCILKSHPDVVNARREAIASLASGLSPRRKTGRLKKRGPVWFSTTQGNATEGGASANVQMLGIQVGVLLFRDGKWLFTPQKSTVVDFGSRFPEFKEGDNWEWSGRKDARKINKFLGLCRSHRRAGERQEREIQWQLAAKLSNRSARGPKAGPFRNRQLVTWHGRFTEVGVSINCECKPTTGNIDLLLRRGKGHSYIALEVKGPNSAAFERALLQAARYATALDYEINCPDLEGDAAAQTKVRRTYRDAFTDSPPQSREKASGATGRIRVGAAIAVPLHADSKKREKQEEKIKKAVEELCSKSCGSRLNYIGVLGYEFSDSAGPYGWKWITECKLHPAEE